MSISETSQYVLDLIKKNADEINPFLDLGNCDLRHLPSELEMCSEHLEELNLGSEYYIGNDLTFSQNQKYNNNFSLVFTSHTIFHKLHKLQKLHARGINFQILDLQSLSHLNSLSDLDVSSNNIGDTGVNYLWKLTALKSLIVSNNNISSNGALLISQLTNLASLNISSNNIGYEGAKHLSSLRHLTSLNISHTNLTDLGAQYIGQLSQLTWLNASNNSISDIGVKHISQLRNLSTLKLNKNNIGPNGAVQISQLSELTSLELSSNYIGDFGLERLSLLKALNNLNISENSIGEEGIKYISRIRSLTSLEIETNNLGEIGAAHISQLELLSRLNININKIGDNGVLHLSKLKKLTHLSISKNEISEKGAYYISLITSLSSLFIHSNSIGDNGAKYLSSLSNLKTLFVSSNNIGDIGANYISRLKDLDYLYISNNYISDEGAKYLSQANKLTSLFLSNNKIGDTGAIFISKLPNVSRLDINSNYISDLTCFEEWLNKGVVFSLKANSLLGNNTIEIGNNPIVTPPIKEIKLGTEAVLQWFQARKTSGGTRPLNECKVIFVGDGAVGKTTLMKQLVGKPTDANEASTHGIYKWAWDGIVNTNSENIKVNLWDFGGQHIQNSLHQFFFDTRVVYVVVLPTRNDGSLNYWLEQIRRLGPESQIILVQNWRTEEDRRLELRYYNSLLPKYPDLPVPILLNAFNGEGMDTLHASLRNAIHLQEDVNEPFPINWFNIKRKLEEQITIKNHTLHFTEFSNWCDDENINDHTVKIDLLKRLNRIGSIVFFNKDILNQLQVLNPDWITIGAYTVLLSEITEKNRGHITRGDLMDIFRNPVSVAYIPDLKIIYQPNDYLYILELMKEFELCVENPLKHGDYLLPPVMGNTPRNYEEFKKGAAIYRFDFDSSFELQIMHRFMARNMTKIRSDDHWNTGILIYQEDGTSALLEAAVYDKQITCWIKGKNKRGFFEVIRESMKDISRAANVSCSELVSNFYEGREYFLEYGKLITALSEGFNTFPYQAGDKILRIDVLEILNHFEDAGKSKEEANIRKIFQEELEKNNRILLNQLYHSIRELKDMSNVITSDINALSLDKEDELKWRIELIEILKTFNKVDENTPRNELVRNGLDLKRIWETMKFFSDAKSISEALPWLAERIKEIGKLVEGL